MNLGVYVSSLFDKDIVLDISKAINKNIGKKLKDASIFYDQPGPIDFQLNCGMFNSTDIWNFKGVLITSSIETTLSALNIVNDIELRYYYSIKEKPHLLSLITICKNDIKFICDSEDSSEDLYRKTGHKPLYIASNFEEVIQGLCQ